MSHVPYSSADSHPSHMAPASHALPPPNTGSVSHTLGSQYSYSSSVVPAHSYQSPAFAYSYADYATTPATAPVSSSVPSMPLVSHVARGAHSTPLTTMHPPMHPPVTSALPGTTNHTGHKMDTSGQTAPPGASRPKVTATLWEDEGSLCFQVEAKGICVARREDNHMINGTKLLNVAGMTRGRRDGILKSEKIRHVVKIGPMHLKGVWIPFDRALEFANKEKITDILYPLFFHDIGSLLYHPSASQQRTNGAPSSANLTATLSALHRGRERRGTLPSSNASTTTSTAATAPPSTTTSSPLRSVPSQIYRGPRKSSSSPNYPRPVIERAHTFPTPPTSASSVMAMTQGTSATSYEAWSAHHPAPGASSLSIETSAAGQSSVPETPTSTPPSKTHQGATHYPTPQSYDPFARPPYHSHDSMHYAPQVRFGPPLSSTPNSFVRTRDNVDHENEHKYHVSAPTYSVPSYATYAPVSHAAPSNDNLRTSEDAIHHGHHLSNTPSRAASVTQSWSGYPQPPPPPPPPPARSNTASLKPEAMTRPTYATVPSHANESYYQPAPVSSTFLSSKRGREDDDYEEENKRVKVEHEDGGPVGGGTSSYTAMNPPARRILRVGGQ